MLPLTEEEFKPHQCGKVCFICGKIFLQKLANNKNYRKVSDHCHYAGKYRGSAHSICDLKLNMHNGIPVAFHNGSKYDYHFTIKEQANKSERQFECFGKNTKKVKEEVTNIDKYGNENVVTILFKDLWQRYMKSC